jgi:Family of unknown function (DUF6334)
MMENELPIGSPLINIVAIQDQTFTGDELCLDQVQFIFQNQTLTLKPIAETDEIELLQTPTLQLTTTVSPDWGRSFLGKKLQTLWKCENAQGYQDQIILAFEHLQPSLAFLSEGSVLKVFQNQPIQKQQASSSKLQPVSS